MPRFIQLLAVTVLAVALTNVPAAGSAGTPPGAVFDAVSANPATAARAIEALRARGPAGLEALIAAHADLLQRGSEPGDQEWRRLSAALDAVAAQRDACAARLYWHTDFDQASLAARESGKPILSLRLLGRLDEDLSCANSRLFRIALYSNRQISELLRQRFILHWKSVRPVPTVTIDFGDGRKLERTLTGNSIHYVLDSDGRVVEALPGLYGPAAFAAWLDRAEQIARSARALDPVSRAAFLRNYHRERLAEIDAAWGRDAAQLDARPPARLRSAPRPDATGAPPSAETAARLAVTKMVVMERPILRGMSRDPRALDQTADESVWSRIGILHMADSRLDEATRSLMLRKLPDRKPETLARAVGALERAIAIDTARNEYVFHSAMHRWFYDSPELELERLTERVYTELFRTPSSDPWLGLRSPDTYVGIDNEGVR
jgi:hypothetical protein